MTCAHAGAKGGTQCAAIRRSLTMASSTQYHATRMSPLWFSAHGLAGGLHLTRLPHSLRPAPLTLIDRLYPEVARFAHLPAAWPSEDVPNPFVFPSPFSNLIDKLRCLFE